MKHLKYDDLVYRCEVLPNFQNTSEIQALSGFIGQDRAKKAVERAIKLKEKGFNIFVVGLSGTGRRTFTTSFLREKARQMCTPNDWVYVYNFSHPSEPIAIPLEAGGARRFKSDMSRLADESMEALEKLFEAEEYAAKKAELEDRYSKIKSQLWEELKEKAKQLGFSVQLTPTGVVTIPLRDGKPLTPEAFESLSDEIKEMFNENSRKLKHIIEGTLYKSRKVEREYKEKLGELDKYAALFTVGAIFDEVKSKYEGNLNVVRYLDQVKSDMLNNLTNLRSENEETRSAYKRRYSVNVVVDNSELTGAPVVYERNPTYSNLVGKVEYQSRAGMLFTDFTLIRAGALHKANGGFLILDAEHLLRNPYSWECLKRALLSEEITVENLESVLGVSNIISLRPQPIPFSAKVVLISTPRIYYLLYTLDEDFRKLFKIKSEFDWELSLTEENVEQYLRFISSNCRKFTPSSLDRAAVNRILWYSSRLAGSKEKLSMQLGEISGLIRESCSIASDSGANIVSETHVLQAIAAIEDRVSLVQSKYDTQIRNFDLMIETQGRKVGQVNGLTVLDLADHSFGVPVKITTKTHLGKPGVVDIQRAAQLSGKIHGKAVMILEGFFGERYARNVPLTLSASISFEQTYGIIEGDSASLAETIALISALSGVPVRQDIAITGSINQHGEVQPVGGVTEKVEGFHRACSLRGLTGSQGVILPSANAKNLILKEEVLESIKKGKFHIWTVENVDEALKIVTGREAGKMTKRGSYRKGSINYLVVEALKKAREISQDHKKTRKTKKRKTDASQN